MGAGDGDRPAVDGQVDHDGGPLQTVDPQAVQVQDAAGLNRELGAHQHGDPHAARLGLLPARQGRDAVSQGSDAVEVERTVALAEGRPGDPVVVGVGLGLNAAPVADVLRHDLVAETARRRGRLAAGVVPAAVQLSSSTITSAPSVAIDPR